MSASENIRRDTVNHMGHMSTMEDVQFIGGIS